MNIAKSEVKLALTRELGQTIEARETAAMTEVNRLEGAIGGLKQAIQCLSDHKNYYKKDLEEAKIEKPICEAMIKAVDHCIGILTNLGDKATTTKIAKHGEWVATKSMLDMIEKMHNDEKNKLAGVLQAIDDGTITKEEFGRDANGQPVLRVVDGRPVNGAAADLQARRTAARQAKEETKTDGAAEGEPATTEITASSEETPAQPATEPEVPAKEKKGYASMKKKIRSGQKE